MRRHIVTAIGGVCAVLVLAGTVAVILLKTNEEPEFKLDPPNPTELPKPSNTTLYKFDTAAISCDAPTCAEIGRKITKDGGTVADTAIAVLLCMGVIRSQSMGIGGGFVMTMYNATSKEAHVLNARETAPAAATENMFKGNSTLSQKGGLAVAVPGEMKGYWELYNKFGGGVEWEDLIAPTIEICENGYVVDVHTRNALVEQEANIMSEPSMFEIYINPATNTTWELGQKIRRPKLAETLRIIAKDGGDALYNRTHDLTKWLVEDLKNDFGGIITVDDMENYKVDWPEPITIPIHGNLMLHTVPPPASGVLVAFILRILNEFQLSSGKLQTTEEAVRTYQLIGEAFKHAFAKRTLLGDPADKNVTVIVEDLVKNLTKSEPFLKEIISKIKETTTSNDLDYYGAEYYNGEDHGTSHLSIIDGNGDAIAVTSTVNLYFGAKIRSKRTGIIYNDEMDDFSAPNITNYFGVPPSEHNFIRPGKRPFSSMCPSIFVDDKGDVRLAVGTAGGTRITTATTYVAIRNLWFNETIKEAIDAPRIHHQLYPMEFEYEYGFLDQWVEGLKKIGHKTVRSMKASSVTNGVARFANSTTLYANWDYRKPGSAAGLNAADLKEL